jgi:hypothetical protein
MAARKRRIAITYQRDQYFGVVQLGFHPVLAAGSIALSGESEVIACSDSLGDGTSHLAFFSTSGGRIRHFPIQTGNLRSIVT